MVITHMEAVKKMHKIVMKIGGAVLASFLVLTVSVHAVNYGAGLYNANLYSAAVPDTAPPVRSTGTPSGALATGTSSTTLSLTTDETATCRYSTTAGIAYASMTSTFGTTGSTTHSTPITGIANGASYTYYIRCIDGATNANTDDYTISFSVASAANTTTGYTPASAAGCGSGAVFNIATGQRCTTVPVIPATSTTPAVPTVPATPASTPLIFTRTLSWKKTGLDVKHLQQYLNTHGFPIAPSGVGSLGKETTYFGLATKAALIKFQTAHKLLPATGTVGPQTKLFIRNNI